MADYLLPADLGQSILNYLVRKPYNEVFELVAAMQRLQLAPERIEPEALGE